MSHQRGRGSPRREGTGCAWWQHLGAGLQGPPLAQAGTLIPDCRGPVCDPGGEPLCVEPFGDWETCRLPRWAWLWKRATLLRDITTQPWPGKHLGGGMASGQSANKPRALISKDRRLGRALCPQIPMPSATVGSAACTAPPSMLAFLPLRKHP